IIEIDGTPVTRLKYPSDFATACGTTGRIQTKANVTDLIPRGADVSITVFTPSTSKRSAPFVFRRN
ncbi:MAG TPA: hypothetical protein VJZ26_16715, partial [Blastocatellia bacterium]|nr:hypothetical protein [Blastocatellia bacterium]